MSCHMCYTRLWLILAADLGNVYSIHVFLVRKLRLGRLHECGARDKQQIWLQMRHHTEQHDLGSPGQGCAGSSCFLSQSCHGARFPRAGGLSWSSENLISWKCHVEFILASNPFVLPDFNLCACGTEEETSGARKRLGT